jgi:hypothetical protein
MRVQVKMCLKLVCIKQCLVAGIDPIKSTNGHSRLKWTAGECSRTGIFREPVRLSGVVSVLFRSSSVGQISQSHIKFQGFQRVYDGVSPR